MKARMQTRLLGTRIGALVLALLLTASAAAQEDGDGGGNQGAPEDRFPQLPATADQVARPGQAGDAAEDDRVTLVQVADGLVDPVNVAHPGDGTGRLFVVERHGRVVIVQDGEVLDEPFLDVSDQTLSAFLEQGIYDIEFHPEFSQNGRFFVHFAELLRNGDSVIVEYTVSDDDPNLANPESAELIMQIDQPWANHNGGELAFGPDGYLYIGSGDGGWEGDPLGAGQDLSTLLGKILRIDVDVPDDSFEGYAIPADNPFADKEGLVQLFGLDEDFFAQLHTEARPEIWAYGLRNPWKFSFDPANGDLYIADVGQNVWEEVDLLPAGASGINFGWDVKMGTHCFPINQEGCADVGVLPIAEYSHERGDCAVIGIGVARGDTLASLDGAYVFGDYCSGRIWATERGDGGAWTMRELLDAELQLTGAGADQAGNLYVTSCQCSYGGPDPRENPPGALWRVMEAERVPEGATTARTADRPQNGGQEEGGGGQEPEQGSPDDVQGQQEDGQAQQEDQEGAGAGQQQEAVDGQALYAQHCAVCHGSEGAGGTGPALAGNEALQDASHVIDQILTGGNGMPPFADQLSNDEVAAVSTYVRTSWSNAFGEVGAEEVAQQTDQ